MDTGILIHRHAFGILTRIMPLFRQPSRDRLNCSPTNRYPVGSDNENISSVKDVPELFIELLVPLVAHFHQSILHSKRLAGSCPRAAL